MFGAKLDESFYTGMADAASLSQVYRRWDMTDRDMGKALHIVPSQFHTIEHSHMPNLNYLREILNLCIERQIVHNTHFASNNHV